MNSNPVYAEQYCANMESYVTKGYVRKLCPEEAEKGSKKTWYLPHFAVSNPNKPGKFRMVFDAAAKSRGVSLNDAMLTGLDLVNPLTSVLFKFREQKIEFCGDINEMFHQVLIRKEDLPAQRFLW